MSGGHYDHLYMRFIDLAERIEEDLAEEGSTLPDDVWHLMQQFKAELFHTAKKARALEYFMSGDTGEESFKKTMEEPFNPYIKEEDVWNF